MRATIKLGIFVCETLGKGLYISVREDSERRGELLEKPRRSRAMPPCAVLLVDGHLKLHSGIYPCMNTRISGNSCNLSYLLAYCSIAWRTKLDGFGSIFMPNWIWARLIPFASHDLRYSKHI